MPANVVTVEALQERLSANPFNAWMGLEIQSLTEEELVVSLKWREEMVSNPKAKYTHGGFWALWSTQSPIS